jgi:hypothetical protein
MEQDDPPDRQGDWSLLEPILIMLILDVLHLSDMLLTAAAYRTLRAAYKGDSRFNVALPLLRR